MNGIYYEQIYVLGDLAYVVIAVVWGFCVIVASLIWWESLGAGCLISGASCLITGVIVGFLVSED